MKSQSFTEIDKRTYQLYMEKNWDELIREGKAALKQDVDYYYLRLRIGIAYYEKGSYKKAQSHFIKALEFNEEDPLVLEYLYYAYTFSAQKQQAALLYYGLSAILQNKIPAPDSSGVEMLAVEYLYNSANTDELVADPETFNGLPSGFQILTRNYHNMSISLHQMVNPGTSLNYAYTFLDKSNYYFYDDGIDRFEVDGQKVRQHQFFLSPSFTSRSGLVFNPSLHFLRVGFELPSISGVGGGPGGGNSVVYSMDYMNQLVGGFSFTKFQVVFNIRFGAFFSNLNNSNQATGSGGLTWYPFGNLDMYLGASLNAHFANLQTGELALIPDLVFGYGIASKVWIEISGSYGEMKNYTESNGFIVYNGLGWMKYKSIGNITVPLTAKGSMIYAGARFAGYENWFIPFDSNQSDDLNTLNYNSTSIFGGLLWKF